jgi:thymidylate synthase
MPATKSLFGYQMRFDLQERFPLLELRKLSFKNIVAELLWFLNGDTNIKFLVDNGCNIWNEDAYNYYIKLRESGLQTKKARQDYSFAEFVDAIKKTEFDKLPVHYIRPEAIETFYRLGDCGYQYGKVWRDLDGVDQIKNLVKSLSETPESRRHILTSVAPQYQNKLALYWCHALVQFNCRPMTEEQRTNWVIKYYSSSEDELIADQKRTKDLVDTYAPKYYLDCSMYQRSADAFLGVPYNIASYALLTEILCRLLNFASGEFIHSFGDVHLYENHFAQASEVINRSITHKDSNTQLRLNFTQNRVIEVLDKNDYGNLPFSCFELKNYNPQPAINAELSTGLLK